MKNWSIVIIILTFISCVQNPKEKPIIQTFKFPTVIQPKTNEKIDYFNHDCLSNSSSIAIGKRKFCDTLQLDLTPKLDTSFTNDYVFEWNNDSFKTDGLELFPNYKSNIGFKYVEFQKSNLYYPVFIVNHTRSSKIINGKDGEVYAIQEALDLNQHWRPIEGRGPDFCGVGKWGLRIHPNEFFVFLMPKYKGNYYTKLRIRIKIGKTTYVSHPFEGIINPKQFYLNKNSVYKYSDYNFYGAEFHN
jgi:hypothetical protein